MNLKILSGKNIKVVLAVSVVLVGCLFHEKLQSIYSTFMTFNKHKVTGVFHQEELTQFNGIQNKKLYLVLLGSIFDVTKGREHYGKGASYNYFIGKDGSRSFITGNFQDESNNKDHVLDLTCNQLSSLQDWEHTFRSKYKYVGVLVGRYYNDDGKPTEYSNELDLRLEKCKIEKEMAKQDELKYPPCNMEWSADQGSRVWCTKTSGGIARSWVGVPRQLYTPGEKRPRCACVDLEHDHSSALLNEYDNCTPFSTSCVLESN
ncbi:neuferricin homolog [Hyposmocoma kahamanoa]|uniref:neuferricin homolog n=1 Tax=Hyposmocoma kahamanoa TaxID=1477025 RepID=UPI000E6D8031|nr:neuferricin homolog [Hyposmocoma kahamanoa]